jgi:uncharacterized membrane protein
LIFEAKTPKVHYKVKERMTESAFEMLKGHEKEVYERIIEDGGIIFQSELVEKTGLPKGL